MNNLKVRYLNCEFTKNCEFRWDNETGYINQIVRDVGCGGHDEIGTSSEYGPIESCIKLVKSAKKFICSQLIRNYTSNCSV